jgi:hypothetical protein
MKFLWLMMIVLLLFLQKQIFFFPRARLSSMGKPGLRRLCVVDAYSAKICSQTASADPILHEGMQ